MQATGTTDATPDPPRVGGHPHRGRLAGNSLTKCLNRRITSFRNLWAVFIVLKVPAPPDFSRRSTGGAETWGTYSNVYVLTNALSGLVPPDPETPEPDFSDSDRTF